MGDKLETWDICLTKKKKATWYIIYVRDILYKKNFKKNEKTWEGEGERKKEKKKEEASKIHNTISHSLTYTYM